MGQPPTCSPPPIRRRGVSPLSRAPLFHGNGCGPVNRAPDALICATATDIAGHCPVDVLVGRRRNSCEEDGGRHDLSGLAISTLRNLLREPGSLQWMVAVLRQALNRRQGLAGCARDRRNAGSNGIALQNDRAGPALRDTAAILRSGEAERITQNPEQWCRRIDLNAAILSVDLESNSGHFKSPQNRWSISAAVIQPSTQNTLATPIPTPTD